MGMSSFRVPGLSVHFEPIATSCKWFITMVLKTLSMLVPLPNDRNPNYWIKSWEPILQVSIFNKTRSRYASISAQSFGTRRLAYFFWVLCCDGFYRRRLGAFGSQVLAFFGLQIFEISDFSGNLWGRYIVYPGFSVHFIFQTRWFTKPTN